MVEISPLMVWHYILAEQHWQEISVLAFTAPDAYFSISFLHFSITFTSPHAYFSISSSFPLLLYYFHTPIGLFFPFFFYSSISPFLLLFLYYFHTPICLFLHFFSYSSFSPFLLLFIDYFHIPGCLFIAPILDLYLLFLEKTRQKCHPHLAASKLLCHTKPVNRWKRLEISPNWKKQWWWNGTKAKGQKANGP